MKKRVLGRGLEVSEMGLGCMGMSEFYGPRNDNESKLVLHKAIDLGCTFFDSADTYGHNHNEHLLGEFLKESRADNIQIATKCGIKRRPGEYQRVIDNSPTYIRNACESSLRRLGIECIDLYYLHRVDPNVAIEDTIQTLSLLVKEGKIANIGLSEVSASTLRKAHAIHPISALQTEYSLWTRDVEREILPTCRELGIGFVPYSPLGRGFLTGNILPTSSFTQDDARQSLPRFTPNNLQANSPLIVVVKDMARRKSCSAAQISLAWLLAQGPDIVPIPGTKNIKHLVDNLESSDVTLTAKDLAQIASALCEFQPVGDRYATEGLKGVNA
ncbi:aldo/keto reductase [Rosenbergiella collisarenosi]|uniref:aldo/keto reductase n=1 Tax=Rosenbergiella collisarenosi TaxID=1544695 RepID=UPI001F500D20|nr:aldo/keto reductase [Rosenbergiella collisarenosi]